MKRLLIARGLFEAGYEQRVHAYDFLAIQKDRHCVYLLVPDPHEAGVIQKARQRFRVVSKSFEHPDIMVFEINLQMPVLLQRLANIFEKIEYTTAGEESTQVIERAA